MNPSSLDRLRALEASYRAALPARLAAMEQAWRLARAGDAARLVELHGLAHRLAGSGGMYGLPALSAAARSLVDLLQPCLGAGLPLAATAIARIETALAALAEAARAGPDDPRPS